MLCFLLPVRSLVVLRSVCKWFLSIIDDPEFVSLHLHRFPGNALEARFLTHKKEVVFRVCEITNCNKEFRCNIIDRVSRLQCSLNGLLLLTCKFSNTPVVVVLWNPSIKKHRRLSLPSKGCFHFGLVHDPSSNDYKVVTFDARRDQAWVYSVKTDTWTEILDNRRRFPVKTCFYSRRSLSVENKVFWIEYPHSSLGMADKLLGFDFETERFRYAEMPYSGDDEMTYGGLVLLDCGSSMGVWWVDDVDDHVHIWALETDAMSWTLRYKIAPPHGFHGVLPRLIVRYGWINGSRLEERNGELVWKYWEPDGRQLSVRSYEIDVGTKVYHMKFQGAVEDCLDIYFESLVMLK